MRLMLYIFLIQQLQLIPGTNFKSHLYCRNIPQSLPLTAMTLTVVVFFFFLNENNRSFCEAKPAVELLELIVIVNHIAVLQSSGLIWMTGECFFSHLTWQKLWIPKCERSS